jgi:hypothetical protein
MSGASSGPGRNQKAEAARRRMGEKVGDGGGGRAPAAPSMPEGCPVTPLAATGSHVWLLDSAHHLLRMRNVDVSKEWEQLAICARNLAWLETHYPKYVRGEKPQRGVPRQRVAGAWDVKAFAHDLMVVAAAQSGFAPEQERHAGAYLGRRGDLILHLGNSLLVAGRTETLGLRDDGWVYTATPQGNALPGPWPHRVEVGPDGPGARLMAHLGQWNYRRQIDPLFIVGWLAQAYIAGALDRRGGLIGAGEPGTGKTDLGAFLRGVLGRWAVGSNDATPAGLQQRVGRSRLAAVLDEFEAEQAAALLMSMRIAHSGGETLRGTADHQLVTFSLYSAICALTTLAPAMTAADRSRVAIVRLVEHTAIELHPMAEGEREILGQQILRLMVDRWEWLRKTCLPAWRGLLLGAGFDHRDSDTLGTLLSCAWTVIHAEPPTEDDFLRYEDDFVALLDELRADRMPGWRRLLGYLLSKQVEAGRGMERRSVGELLREAIGASTGWRQRDLLEEVTEDMRSARRLLGQYGLKIELADAGVPGIRAGAPVLLVANQCAMLTELLRGSPWEGSAGRTTVWRDVLASFPSAYVPRNGKYFVFGKHRAVALPLHELAVRMLGGDTVDAVKEGGAG